MYMENVFELGVIVLINRINKLIREKQISKARSEIVSDIFAGFEHNYEPWAFQVDRGTFFPEIKKNPANFVKPVSAATKEWLLAMRAAGKVVFLATSSNADYAKLILENIFVGEDYWKYFDICLCDARKPHFFLGEAPFYSLKQDYPEHPTNRLASGRWYAQGNYKVLESYFREELKLGDAKPSVCYFGDSLKSDVISCAKVAGWAPVFLVEELLLKAENSDLLEEDDAEFLSEGHWKDVKLEDTILYALGMQHAKLISPTLESLSRHPIDKEFENKIHL